MTKANPLWILEAMRSTMSFHRFNLPPGVGHIDMWQWLCRDRRLVYIIQCEDDFGPVKIGMTSDLRQRLVDLQAANPYPLRVLTVMCGGRTLEKALHRRFTKSRRHGEWFSFSSELREFVAVMLDVQHRSAA